MAEGAGIEPATANKADIGFEDRGDHQIPSTSLFVELNNTDTINPIQLDKTQLVS